MKNLFSVKINSFLLFLFLSIFLNRDTSAQRYWNIAAQFDGTNSVSVVPTTTLQNLTGSFTVECWFKVAPGGAGTLFGKTGLRLLIDAYGDKFRGRMQTNNITKLYTRHSSAMEANKWYHLACTYNSTTGLMIFYINGSSDTSLTATGYGPFPDTDTLYIGTSPYGSFKGAIDDIRIWNRDLSGSEIRQNMRIPHVSLFSEYFAEGAVMSASFDFTYTRNASVSLFIYDGANFYINLGAEAIDIGSYPSQTLTINPALDLTNTGYVQMTSNVDIELTRPVTVEAWIYPVSVGSTLQYILKKGTDYELVIDDFGFLRITLTSTATSTVPIPANKWTHIAIACDESGTASLYINGKHDVTTDFGEGPEAGKDDLIIGADENASNYFKGYIDAVNISNYRKSEDEIRRDMFRIIDFHNKPQPPQSTVSLNFDYFNYSSTGLGTFYYYEGNARHSPLVYNSDIPVSPIIGNNISFFEEYQIKYSGKRIPSSNTAGYMEVDSLLISDSSQISDLQLFVALNHETLYDLQIILQAPSGDSVIIWNNNFGMYSSVQHIITVFDDDADSSIINAAYVDFGPYIKPVNSLKSAFAGKNSAGIWKIKITDLYNGSIGYLYGWGLRIEKSLTGVEENYASLPGKFKLEQNYPNPFNPETIIKYSIPTSPQTLLLGKERGMSEVVSLKVYDILGNEVAILVNEEKSPGFYEVEFNAYGLSSGIYFYRLKAGNFSDTKKLILLK